jgi:GDP/UDP-N,N'-diacetylbacillosamine 2-epimerase (hydrolysing)
VPNLKVGSVSIEERQNGRVRVKSVIDCEPTYGRTRVALKRLFDSEFQRQVSSVVNPHGSGDASGQIVESLRDARLGGLTKKEFFAWLVTGKHE